MEQFEMYCLNYNNPYRREYIQSQLSVDNIHIEDMTMDESLSFCKTERNVCYMHSGVQNTDPRINHIDNPHKKKISSTTYGHLDNLAHFLKNSDKKWVVLCEDDILFRNDWLTEMSSIIETANEIKAELVLLSYLLPFHLDRFFPNVGIFQCLGHLNWLWLY